MYYHGSPVGDIELLEPRISIHNEPYVYLCSNIAHATLYAVKCHMYPYGFNKENGRLTMDEPFEKYLEEIYSGKSSMFTKSTTSNPSRH